MNCHLAPARRWKTLTRRLIDASFVGGFCARCGAPKMARTSLCRRCLKLEITRADYLVLCSSPVESIAYAKALSRVLRLKLAAAFTPYSRAVHPLTRRAVARKITPRDVVINALAAGPVTTPTPKAVLGALTRIEVRCLTACVLDGRRQREVAAELGTTQQAVAACVARAKQKLKRTGVSMECLNFNRHDPDLRSESRSPVERTVPPKAIDEGKVGRSGRTYTELRSEFPGFRAR